MGILANGLSAVIFAVSNVIIRALKDKHVVAVGALHSTVSAIISAIVLVIYRTIINPNGFNYNANLF